MSRHELTMDGKTISFDSGETLLEVAVRCEIEIPNLCRGMGEHRASCLLCLVRDRANGAVIPACETRALPGMDILTEDDELRALRSRSLSMLLLDHGGDCRAPCALACPAALDVDRMIALFDAGRGREAADVLYRAMPIPRTVSLLCKAPCEAVCRLGAIAGNPVSVRGIKASLAAEFPLPVIGGERSKGDVLVAGSGPAGLSALWTLFASGYAVTLADPEEPGASLRAACSSLGADESEIARLEVSALLAATGATVLRTSIHDERLPPAPRGTWSAVVLAMGTSPMKQLPIGWFSALTEGRKGIAQAISIGRDAALTCVASLEGLPMPPRRLRQYPSRLGGLSESERSALVKRRDGMLPSGMATSSGCLRCGCSGFDGCRLKELSLTMNVTRKPLPRLRDGSTLIAEVCGSLSYESAKCVRCGLCVAEAVQCDPSFPLSFGFRGISTRLVFDSRFPASTDQASRLAAVCPTAALREISQ